MPVSRRRLRWLGFFLAGQPTKFTLVVNLRAARALGRAMRQSIRLRADRVIE